MPTLRDKTILIVSPQAWGKMHVSKHHYAIELTKYGNKVYYLNPPVTEKDKRPAQQILIEPSDDASNLSIISHYLGFPYNIKFHLPWLFHMLMKPHIRAIAKKIGRPIDIVWSFDLGNLYPFRLFPGKPFRIFHPVDEPLNQTAFDSAKDANIIFSVTREILDKYRQYGLPSHFINHGLANSFLDLSQSARPDGDPIRVGLSGNFLRKDIDQPTLLRIVKENPSIIFECWGSYKMNQSNIAGSNDPDTQAFISALGSSPNVIMHGAIPASQLAKAMCGVDAFLICYDIKKDQSGGTNYHKIMEYLSTGNVIISNNVTTYKDKPELITMTSGRQDNTGLAELFSEVANHLPHYNSAVLRQQRIGFARNNTYSKQIIRIEELINPAAWNSPEQTIGSGN